MNIINNWQIKLFSKKINRNNKNPSTINKTCQVIAFQLHSYNNKNYFKEST
jgi:hypothetical protein